jgi:hypothetical protein
MLAVVAEVLKVGLLVQAAQAVAEMGRMIRPPALLELPIPVVGVAVVETRLDLALQVVAVQAAPA